MKSMRKLLSGAALLFGAMTTCVCASTADDTWRLGAVISTTGAYSALGGEEKQAMTALADKINAQGGILGKKIEIVYEDDEGVPAKTINMVKKVLFEHKVIGILGPSFAAAAMASAPIAEEAGVPMLYMTPAGDPWKDRKYIFQVTPDSAIDARFIIDYLENTLKLKKVALLHGPAQYDMVMARQLDEVFRANPKMELVATEKWGKDDKDMTTYLLNLRKQNPEAIIIAGSTSGPPVAIRNMRDLDMDIPIICTSGCAQARFLELGGTAVNGVYVTSRLSYGSPLPEEKDIFEAINKGYGIEPSSFHANGWDALLLMAEAIRQGAGDPKKMRDSLESLKNFKGSIGTYNMSPTNHNGLSTEAVVMLKIKDQNWSLAK